jgi:hypothetical protein
MRVEGRMTDGFEFFLDESKRWLNRVRWANHIG